MPKVAYSEEERDRIRSALITTALDLMAHQGIQHTTVEQIYRSVGISRTFFYTFFPSKEDLIVEALYLACCYGEQHGIAVLTIEEQQKIFCRLSPESYQVFRQKQFRLFGSLLECFGIQPDSARIHLFTNLSLTAMVIRRAIPQTLPLFVSEAADETLTFQIDAIVTCMEQWKTRYPASS